MVTSNCTVSTCQVEEHVLFSENHMLMPVMKSRGLWNALESAGLSYIKASPSPDIFMDHCRAQYNKIEEELRKRWIWETTHH